jgi:hypothetical protein
VRENFTQLVTTGPKQGSKMNHISVDVVHNARRESLPVTDQAVYDDILGALAAMGTTNCSEALVRRVCEDHGILIVGEVVVAHARSLACPSRCLRRTILRSPTRSGRSEAQAYPGRRCSAGATRQGRKNDRRSRRSNRMAASVNSCAE